MVITPTIALFEVALKIVVTEGIFSVFTDNALGVDSVTTSIWFVNLIVPATIGSLLILGIKLFKKDEVS
jgi:hypothetical protein